MEGIGAEKMMVSFMVLMMVVLAQGHAELADINPAGETFHCARKCALKCMFKFYPTRIALCFGLCMISCKLQPSEVVYNCTSGCANSMLNTYNPTDDGEVDNFVGFCYKTCKQRHKN